VKSTTGFPREARLILKKDFTAVLDTGRKTANRDFVLWWKASAAAIPRLGVMATKKTGGAVRRNRLKRLVREVFRLNSGNIGGPVDMVLCPRRGNRLDGLRTAENSVKDIWRKAGIIGND
jgi:ribonuclease P protein component